MVHGGTVNGHSLGSLGNKGRIRRLSFEAEAPPPPPPADDKKL